MIEAVTEYVITASDGLEYAIPMAQIDALRAEVARLYDAPLAECILHSAAFVQHLDECDDGDGCMHHYRNARFIIVTIRYPGRARGQSTGPLTHEWHSTWGRKYGSDHDRAGTFELYAD